MPVKRRKLDSPAPTASPKPPARTDKPLSAIAAARLRAEAAKTAAEKEATPEPQAAASPAPALTPEHAASPAPDSPSESESDSSPPPARATKLSTWTHAPSAIHAETAAELTITLAKNSTIALLGTFDLHVLRGAINIDGANLGAVTRDGERAGPWRVSVPATHPVLKIRGLDGENRVRFVGCEDAGMGRLGSVWEGLWNEGVAGERGRSFGVITTTAEDPLGRPLQPHAAPETWLRAVEDCAAVPNTTLVAGLPETGKSSFCTRLINRYLTGLGRTKPAVPAVAFLDLDPGAQEYAPPGQIALVVVRELNLGPTFAHPVAAGGEGAEVNETVRAHVVPLELGDYQDYYAACVEDLCLAFRALSARDPALSLVINTPGWLATTHSAILTQLVRRCKPQQIVQMGDEPLPALRDTSVKHSTLHTITAQRALATPYRSPAALRAMATQSYFHLATVAPPTWSAAPLTTLRPWEFAYRSTPTHRQSLVGFLALTTPPPASALLHYLSGAVIHILQTPAPQTTLPRTPISQIPYFPLDAATGVVTPPDPRATRLICVALVRGFDPVRGVVQVLVPRALDGAMAELQAERTVFAVGCCERPGWAYVEDAYVRQYEEEAGERRFGGDEDEETPVWVEREGVIDGMGYMGAERRVRKFITGEKEKR
ncbi:hypothetical protein C7974DRAFT_450712 [Boeremia exigua]|uniref:uncharacterized protein n=1 Tax=Boeremia exigua TaxID=749465 RepID=UPI001E8D7FE7|nr:uncharacterized protein C7974DRAFT_450712 [Boeremia exigua]KAH6637711.1 hypothetical protein C7974DRAFT_450712 [Boeremia exigua]